MLYRRRARLSAREGWKGGRNTRRGGSEGEKARVGVGVGGGGKKDATASRGEREEWTSERVGGRWEGAGDIGGRGKETGREEGGAC